MPKAARPLRSALAGSSAPARSPVRLASDEPGFGAAPSPALLMQARLADEVTREERWSWRLTVTFILVTCTAFWGGLYALMRALVG